MRALAIFPSCCSFASPFSGIRRVEEAERYFDENRVREAQNGINAGLEKLKIYQRLVNNISDQT